MNIHDPFDLLRTKKQSIGTPPGTIDYSGDYSDVDIKIEVIRYNKDKFQIDAEADIKNISKIISGSDLEEEIIWVNIIGLHNKKIIELIGRSLNIHQMDLEDIVHVSQWSKIINQNDYLFSIFKMIYLNEEEIIHEQVSVIVKNNLVITFQETPGDVFDHIRSRLESQKGQLRFEDSNYLFYSILDAIVDEYMLVINYISLRFNEIEMQIIEERSPNKEELYRLRKELLYFSNSISPLQDTLRRFVTEESAFYTQDMSPYYSDIKDHLSQISDSIMGYREMSNSLHEVSMSNVSMRMNRAMMTLTIFSAIFIPLSFLAGVFGMNFKYMPGLNEPKSFIYFAIFCITLASGMITYFKARKWF